MAHRKQQGTVVVGTRLTPADAALLESVAMRSGVNRAEVIREILIAGLRQRIINGSEGAASTARTG